MDRTGKSFDVNLEKIHLKWGTTGMTDGSPRDRSELEAYIPIPMRIAKELNLLRSDCFYVENLDFQLRVSGSQGPNNEYGKQFTSAGNLKPLGIYLKNQLNLQPGNRVRVEWISQDTVSIAKI